MVPVSAFEGEFKTTTNQKQPFADFFKISVFKNFITFTRTHFFNWDSLMQEQNSRSDSSSEANSSSCHISDV